MCIKKGDLMECSLNDGLDRIVKCVVYMWMWIEDKKIIIWIIWITNNAMVIWSLASLDSLPNKKCLTLFLFDWPNSNN